MSYLTIKYLATLSLGLNNVSNKIVKVKAERCETTADEMWSVLLVPVITWTAVPWKGWAVFRDLLQQASHSLGSNCRVQVFNIQWPFQGWCRLSDGSLFWMYVHGMRTTRKAKNNQSINEKTVWIMPAAPLIWHPTVANKHYPKADLAHQ